MKKGLKTPLTMDQQFINIFIESEQSLLLIVTFKI